jgi:hypothetical protein
MHVRRNWIILSCMLMAVAVLAWAQGRKPGLYEVTSDMTWQQSPFPAGMGPGGRGPRTMQVCVTQAQIDKYGGPAPQTRGDCQVSNKVMKADGYTAEFSCTGQMSAKGTVEASFTPDGHGKTKIHMVGTMQMGQNSAPVEYTMTSDSTYKGEDCGSVKPVGTN